MKVQWSHQARDKLSTSVRQRIMEPRKREAQREPFAIAFGKNMKMLILQMFLMIYDEKPTRSKFDGCLILVFLLHVLMISYILRDYKIYWKTSKCWFYIVFLMIFLFQLEGLIELSGLISILYSYSLGLFFSIIVSWVIPRFWKFFKLTSWDNFWIKGLTTAD